MVDTQAVQTDKATLTRLRIFVASQNNGSTYRLLGKAVTTAINEYIDRREKEYDDLAASACEYNGL